MGSAREEHNGNGLRGQLPVRAVLPVDMGKRFETVSNILAVVAMKQTSTQMSLHLASRTRTDRSWPVKGAFWQTDTGTPAAQLHRTSAKSLLQFRVDESVRDGLARTSGELIQRALARIEIGRAHV